MMRLRELRKELNLTQKEISSYLEIEKYNIANWEQGRSEPSIADLIRLADCFGVSVDYLVGREDDFGVKTYEKTGQSTDRPEADDIERQALAILHRYPPEHKKHALVALENDLDTIVEVKKSLRTNF